MDTSDVVKVFEKKRPICVMAQMILDRLLAHKVLDALFRDVAEEQYERTLLFSSLARLMSLVTLGRAQSVSAAYRRMKGEIGVSLNAVYTKLDRLEPRISQALVRYSYQQLKGIYDAWRVADKGLLAGYTPKILDGNHFSATQHRLPETRNSTAAPLPGKALVVLDPRREAIADLFPIEDGQAQERSALDDVIETIQMDDLWIADRNFCTLKFFYSIDARNAKFIIRQHQQLEGFPAASRRYVGKIETGRVYERTLQLPSFEGKTLGIRRIEVELLEPTRDGHSTLVILSNLPEDEADALCIADLYRCRWRIENAFQKLTTSLQCEVHTLCYPKAAIFAFSLASLAYNAVSMLLAAIRAEHGCAKTKELSFYYLSLEIAEAHDGMMIAIPGRHWQIVRKLSPAKFAAHLRRVARHIDFNYFRKSKRGPKKKKPNLQHQLRQVHVSSAKILAARKH